MSRDEDIVDYLLGELPPADRARVERAMDDDPELAAEVERMRPLVAGLEELPPEAWGAPHGEVPALPALPPLGAPAPERRGRRARPRTAIAVAAAVAALAVAVAVGALVRSSDSGGGGPRIALASVGEGGPAATGTARASGGGSGSLRLEVSGLRPSADAQFYELWLLDGPRTAVSLGAFRVPASGAADVTVPLPFALTDFRYIDVSVEPEDGVATHSGRSVLRGPTAA